MSAKPETKPSPEDLCVGVQVGTIGEQWGTVARVDTSVRPPGAHGLASLGWWQWW